MIDKIIELLSREPNIGLAEPSYIQQKYKNPIKKIMDDYEDAANIDKLTNANKITDEVKDHLRSNMERLLVGQDKLDVI